MKKLLLLLIIHFTVFVSINASTLNLSITSSPSRLNPILPADSASSEISSWIFNGLLKYDKDGNITTDLASSYEFINEQKLIIHIKKGVFWHDGVEFTADDVIFTYKSILSPKVFTPLKTNFQLVESVIKKDKYTLEINYKKPYFKALEIWMQSIIPKHILENEKDLMTSSFNKKPIGTGPYTLEDFKVSQDIILHANKNYFEGKPKIDELNYKFVPDPTTTFLMLKQKQLDLGGLQPLQIDRQIDQTFKEYYTIVEKQSFGYTYLGFNLRNKKFQDIKIRKALSLAINRQELVDILFFGHGKVCNGPFLPGTFAFNKEVTITNQNKKEALKLLKEAGFDKNNPFTFEIVTNTGNDIRINAAQILQHQLASVGVKMKIRVMEWQAFLNTIVHPRNFDAVLLGWGLSIMPDAKPLWHSTEDKKGGFNLVGYKNKEVDTLIDKAEKTVNREKLGILYKEIFTKIANDIPYLFLYIPNSITVINKKIKNVQPAFTGLTHNQKDWIKE